MKCEQPGGRPILPLTAVSDREISERNQVRLKMEEWVSG